MTNKRIILTNKETGQQLPEANVVSDFGQFEIQFDGTEYGNSFSAAEWTATYPHTFRNGNVIRPVDPNTLAAPIYFERGAWYFRSEPEPLEQEIADGLLENDDWELV